MHSQPISKSGGASEEPVIEARVSRVATSARLASGVQIFADELVIGERAEIGEGTKINGGTVTLEDNIHIGSHTSIRADQFFLGYGSRIEDRCVVAALGKPAQEIRFGDNCLVGHDSKILVPVFRAGDYTKLHNHLFVSGYKDCVLGHNVWVGQNCILNSNDYLTIGNNVGIGAYSSVWTHAWFGELLEGCNVYKVAPVVIEDDVWIVGSYNVISPGVTIGRKALVLTCSAVSKDVPPNHCVGGVPAKDLTDKMVPYRDISLEEKYALMRTFVEEFVAANYPATCEQIERGFRVGNGDSMFELLFFETVSDQDIDDAVTALVFTKQSNCVLPHEKTTIFDLSSKKYTKRRSRPEIELIGFLLSHRARFLPAE